MKSITLKEVQVCLDDIKALKEDNMIAGKQTEISTIQEENKLKRLYQSIISRQLLSDFLSKLRGKNIMKVEVSYNGYGDSGESFDVSYFDKEGNGHTDGAWNYSDSQQRKFADTVQINRQEIDKFYEALETLVDYDWVNNEGGGGTIVIDTETKKIDIDPHYNEMIETPCHQLIEANVDLSMDEQIARSWNSVYRFNISDESV